MAIKTTFANIKAMVIRTAVNCDIHPEFQKEVYFCESVTELKEILQVSSLELFDIMVGRPTVDQLRHIDSLI